MATVKQALTNEKTLETNALTQARIALAAAGTRDVAAKKELATRKDNLAKADAKFAETRANLAVAEPAAYDALKAEVDLQEKQRASARVGVIAQQQEVSAAAIELAIAVRPVTRGNARVTELESLVAAATEAAKDHDKLVSVVEAAPLAAQEAQVDTATAALKAKLVQLRTALIDTDLIDAEHQRRLLENVRRRNAHVYADRALDVLDQGRPARATTRAVAAAERAYERARSRAAQLAAQAKVQTSQANAFLLEPVPLLVRQPVPPELVIAKNNIVAALQAQADEPANGAALAKEKAFLDQEIPLEVARHALEAAKLDELADPSISIVTEQGDYDAAVAARTPKPTTAEYDALRAWRRVIPEDVKRYVAQLEDMTDMLDSLKELYDEDVGQALTDADTALAAAITAEAAERRRLEKIDDEATKASLESTRADEQFSVVSTAVARGEMPDAVTVP